MSIMIFKKCSHLCWLDLQSCISSGLQSLAQHDIIERFVDIENGVHFQSMITHQILIVIAINEVALIRNVLTVFL